MQGTQTTGYSGTNLDLKDRNIPVQLSPKQNAAVVEFKWSENFSDFDPVSNRYSLSISPLVQRTQTFYFTVDTPTEGPVEVWGKSLKDGNLTSFGKFDNFTLSTADFQRILFSIDFDRWTMSLESEDTFGSIPLPKSYRNLNLNLSGLDLGLSQIPLGTTFIDAMNTGTGTYSANFQKVEIGSKLASTSGPMTSSPGATMGDGLGAAGPTFSKASSSSSSSSSAHSMSKFVEDDEEEDIPVESENQQWDQVHGSMLEGVEQPTAQPSGNPQLVIFILLALLIFFLVMMAKK